MPDLEPITREEKLWSGEDIEPITRKEMFIKRIYDKTQVIPEPITREEMFLKKAGEGGSDVDIKQLSVTENGTYSEENTAYSPVIVNVPAPPIPDNAYLLNEVEDVPADIVTFDDGSNLPMPSLKTTIVPIQSGSGDPSPSNVRPISGWSGANVYNLDNTDKSPFFKGLTNGTFGYVDLGTLRWYKSGENNFYAQLPQHKVVAGDTPINGLTSNGMIFKQLGGSGNAEYIIITAIGYETYTPAQFKTAMDGVQLIYELATPTTPTITPQQFNTLLEAFNIDGLMVSIPFTDGQGQSVTVYGGTLDVTSGVLMVDRAYVDLGTQNYSYYSGNLFTTPLSYLKPVPNERLCNALCSIYVAKRGNEYASIDGSFVAGFNNSPILAIHDSRFADATAFKTAMNGVQLVYELATPITYQLTPTSIKSLEGENNVWASTGDVTELEYFSKEV